MRPYIIYTEIENNDSYDKYVNTQSDIEFATEIDISAQVLETIMGDFEKIQGPI